MDVALLWLCVIDEDEDVFALVAAAAAAAAAALFRVARFDARADIRRFKSSRNSDFSGDTYTHTQIRLRNDMKRIETKTKRETNKTQKRRNE